MRLMREKQALIAWKERARTKRSSLAGSLELELTGRHGGERAHTFVARTNGTIWIYVTILGTSR
jgi:hypothetical protein